MSKNSVFSSFLLCFMHYFDIYVFFVAEKD